MHEILHVRRLDIEQLDPAVQLLAQLRPVEIEERMISRDLAHHIIGDARPFTEPGKMQLLHLAFAADVVNEIVRFPLAPNESHRRLPFRAGPPSTARSVRTVHYTVNSKMPGNLQGCFEKVISRAELGPGYGSCWRAPVSAALENGAATPDLSDSSLMQARRNRLSGAFQLTGLYFLMQAIGKLERQRDLGQSCGRNTQ
jgi:hypothetical protein